MELSNKTQALLGFAIKSSNIIFGTDNILSYRISKYLILYDAKLSENAQKKLARHAQEHNIPILLSPQPLCELVHRDAVKAVAVTDQNLASAIIECFRDSGLGTRDS